MKMEMGTVIDKPQYSSIVWRNIYYMLCYSIKYLAELRLTESSFENVSGTVDLFARILVKSHEYSLAYSRLTEYKSTEYSSENPRGKLDIYKSLYTGEYYKGRLCFKQTTLDENSFYNRVIKSAYMLLINSNKSSYYNNIETETQNKLYNLFQELSTARELDSTELLEIVNGKPDLGGLPNWHRPVVAASIVIIKYHIYNDNNANRVVFGFNNYAQLNLIFETFVRNCLAEMFAKEGYGHISRPVYREPDGRSLRLDALAVHNKKYLIIDMKWYEQGYDTSANEYQVYRYIGATPSNLEEFTSDIDNSSLAGMLIYAKSKNEFIKKHDGLSSMTGILVPIYIEVLDLDTDFESLKNNLYKIVHDAMENKMLTTNNKA